MYYKEFLRVRKVFAWFAGVMACLLLLVGLLSGHGGPRAGQSPPLHAAHHFGLAPGAALHRPNAGAAAGAPENDGTNVRGAGIKIGNLYRAPLSVFAALAGFAAAIFATIVGCCLAAENSGHLEIAWTRPASRISYAARVMLVDVGGILAAFTFALVALALFVAAKGWWQFIYVDHAFWTALAHFVLYPLSWFGLVAALTASMKNGAGLVAGLSWPVASVMAALLAFDLPPALAAVVRFIDYLNPVVYGSYSATSKAGGNVEMLLPGAGMLGLVAVAVIGVVAALVQWQRLEA